MPRFCNTHFFQKAFFKVRTFFHTAFSFHSTNKKVRSNRERTEKCVSIVATQFLTNQDTLLFSPSGNRIFAKPIIGE